MNDSPMKLQILAAKSVCIRLVREWAEEGEIPVINVWKRAAGYGTCPAHDWYLWQLSEMPIPRFAHIQNTIRYQIEDNMAPILDQVVIWIQHHHGADFFNDQQSSFLSEYISKLVWNHHFQIDYAASAKNILTNTKLSPLERFRFAGTYCIVEEIEKFRDTIDSMPKLDFKKDPFVVYWSKYLRNELHTIPVPKDMSLNSLMIIISSSQFGLWAPVEYFFGKLTQASKLVNIEPIIRLYGNSVRMNLPDKFNDKEWNLAFRPVISKIVEKIVECGTLDEVRCIWSRFRSKMDSKNFCSILETLVPLSMRNATSFKKWTPLLMEIWTSAASELKQSAIVDTELWHSIGRKCEHLVRFENAKDFRARRQIPESMKFIRMVLKSTNVKKRTEFLEQNFSWLIIWTQFTTVDRLIREFLERYNRDVVKLKQSIADNSAEIERSLLIFLSFGEFDEFDVVTRFYFPGIKGVAKDTEEELRNGLMCHKWDLVTSGKGLMFLATCLYFADWKQLYEFVQKMCSVAGYSLNSFMFDLFERGHLPGLEYLTRKLERGEMIDLKECLSKLECHSEGDVVRRGLLMRQFKTHMFKALFDIDSGRKMIFNRADVQDFLLWIYNGDEILVEKHFKQPVLFPKGFLVQLIGCFDDGHDGFLFQASKSMEEFLKWCFAKVSERRRFKREMIYKFKQYKIIEDILLNRRCRRSALFWFFDGDVGLIEKFTADCAGIPMYTIVENNLRSARSEEMKK
ncbi:uncharacterized protein LOC135837949 [Planococcus citri]|uniref:uncharacterized protein LOC135837949 n=1 Tax=Planococcus citri TaxID=170843 RepID=UPI0031F91C9A